MNEGTNEFRSWLIERVAKYCRKNIESIDSNANFSDYGLDSVSALTLVGDMEDYLGFELETTIIWDFPSISKLVNHVELQSLALPK